MGELSFDTPEELADIAPDISHIITEDDEPMDNIFSEKQQRLLTESLNTSWTPGRPFVAAANVGLFYAIHQPPVVPDMFLSMDVTVARDIWKKEHRSYFLWEFGKPPELAVEIVSNSRGGEIDRKLKIYAQSGIWYYIVYDPQQILFKESLRVYELTAGGYIPKADRKLVHLNLGVTLWEGEYENSMHRWLRWCDENGDMIPTGKERADSAEKIVEEERHKAEQERQKAEHERQRAERLAEKLKSLGVSPDP